MPYTISYTEALREQTNRALDIPTDAPDALKTWGVYILAGASNMALPEDMRQNPSDTLARLQEVYRTNSVKPMLSDDFGETEELWNKANAGGEDAQSAWNELAKRSGENDSVWTRIDAASALTGADLQDAAGLMRDFPDFMKLGQAVEQALLDIRNTPGERGVNIPTYDLEGKREAFEPYRQEARKRLAARRHVERVRQKNAFAMMASILPDLTDEAKAVIDRAAANGYKLADGDEGAFLNGSPTALPEDQQELVASYLQYVKPTDGSGAWGQFWKRMGDQAWSVTKNTGSEFADLFTGRMFRGEEYNNLIRQRAMMERINARNFRELGWLGESVAEVGGIIGYWSPMLAELAISSGGGALAKAGWVAKMARGGGAAAKAGRALALTGRVANVGAKYIGHTMFTADFMEQYKQRIVLEGGDISDPKVQLVMFGAALSANAVEHISWGTFTGKFLRSEMQSKAYAKLFGNFLKRCGVKIGTGWGDMTVGKALLHWGGHVLASTATEALEEAGQQAIEETVVDFGDGRNVRLGNLMEQGSEAFMNTFGPMLLLSVVGSPFRAGNVATAHNLDQGAIKRLMSASERLKSLAAQGKLTDGREDVAALNQLMFAVTRAPNAREAVNEMLRRGFSWNQANGIVANFQAIQREAIERGQLGELGENVLPTREELERTGWHVTPNDDGTLTASRDIETEGGKRRRQTLNIRRIASQAVDVNDAAQAASALNYMRERGAAARAEYAAIGIDLSRTNDELLADPNARNALSLVAAREELRTAGDTNLSETRQTQDAQGNTIDEDVFDVTLAEQATRQTIFHEVAHAVAKTLRNMGLSEKEVEAIQNWRSGRDGRAAAVADLALPELSSELWNEERVGDEMGDILAGADEASKGRVAKAMNLVGDLVKRVLHIQKRQAAFRDAVAVYEEVIRSGKWGNIDELTDAQKRLLAEARQKRAEARERTEQQARPAAGATVSTTPNGEQEGQEGPSSGEEGTKPDTGKSRLERVVEAFCFNKPILRDDMAELAASGELTEDDIYETGYRWSPLLRCWTVRPECRNQPFTPNGPYMGLDGTWRGEAARNAVTGRLVPGADLSDAETARELVNYFKTYEGEEPPKRLLDASPAATYAWFKENLVGKTFLIADRTFTVKEGHYFRFVCETPEGDRVRKGWIGRADSPEEARRLVESGAAEATEIAGYVPARAASLPFATAIFTKPDAILTKGHKEYLLKKFKTGNANTDVAVFLLNRDGETLGLSSIHMREIGVGFLNGCTLAAFANEGASSPPGSLARDVLSPTDDARDTSAGTPRSQPQNAPNVNPENQARASVAPRLPSPEFAMDGTIADALPAHLREDARAIIAERAGTPAWMVEPDGTPTELNERDWLRREAEARHQAKRFAVAHGNNLIAVHYLSADDYFKVVDADGKLVAPSISISDAKFPRHWGSAGSGILLAMKPEVVDASNPDVDLFGADAGTPMVNFLDDEDIKDAESTVEKLKELRGQEADNILQGIRHFENTMDDALILAEVLTARKLGGVGKTQRQMLARPHQEGEVARLAEKVLEVGNQYGNAALNVMLEAGLENLGKQEIQERLAAKAIGRKPSSFSKAATDILNTIKEIDSASKEYLEAKVYRAVPLTDAALAIVGSEDAGEIGGDLEARGVKVVVADTQEEVEAALKTHAPRFAISGLYTGSAAEYANRDVHGNIVNKPSLHYIGEGEGNQAFGWGLYASNSFGIASGYARRDVRNKGNYERQYLSNAKSLISAYSKLGMDKAAMLAALEEGRKLSIERYGNPRLTTYYLAEKLIENPDYEPKATANLYEQTFFTNRATPEETERHLLKWYEPVSEEQMGWVKEELRAEGLSETTDGWELGQADGWMLYKMLEDKFGSAKGASEFLARAGIDGVKYPVDSYGKTVKDGDKAGWNYVSFRDDNIRVDHKWVDGERRYQIAGRAGAERLGIRGLGDAEAMERSEATREEIWRETGWWRGADGKWRVEIGDIRLADDWKEKVKAGCQLRDIVSGPALEAYDNAIGGVWVSVDQSLKGSSTVGVFNIRLGTIRINPNGTRSKSGFLTTLAHEIQHTIQLEEGLERGTSLSYQMDVRERQVDMTAFPKAWGEYERRNKEFIPALSRFVQSIAEPWLRYIHDASIDEKGRVKFPYETKDEFPRINGRMIRSLSDIAKGVEKKLNRWKFYDIGGLARNGDLADVLRRVGADELGWFLADAMKESYGEENTKWATDAQEAYAKMAAEAAAGIEEADAVVKEISRPLDEAFADARNAYNNAGGEVEARMVEARLGLTEEQRKEIPPWVTEAVVRQDTFSTQADYSYDAQRKMKVSMAVGGGHSVAPRGAQKEAGTEYPDAGAEIGGARFAVGSGRRAEYARLLAKHRPDLDVGKVLSELDKYGNPKKEKAALHWVVRGTVILPEDEYKVDDALAVAEKAKVDPFAYGSPMELLQAHKELKPPTRGPIDPDTVPELSDKRDVGHGVTTYLVQDDEAGQKAMREILNAAYGKDFSPWCLLHGDGKGGLSNQAWGYWHDTYNSLPKRVAFQNGKPIAFMATRGDYRQERLEMTFEEETGLDAAAHPERFQRWTRENGYSLTVPEQWWDTKDDAHEGIPVLVSVEGDPLGRVHYVEIASDGTIEDGPGGWERHSEGLDEEWVGYSYTRKEMTPNGQKETKWYVTGGVLHSETINMEDGRGHESKDEVVFAELRSYGGFSFREKDREKIKREDSGSQLEIVNIGGVYSEGSLKFASGTLENSVFDARRDPNTGELVFQHGLDGLSDAEFRKKFDAWREKFEKLVERPADSIGPEEREAKIKADNGSKARAAVTGRVRAFDDVPRYSPRGTMAALATLSYIAGKEPNAEHLEEVGRRLGSEVNAQEVIAEAKTIHDGILGKLAKKENRIIEQVAKRVGKAANMKPGEVAEIVAGAVQALHPEDLVREAYMRGAGAQDWAQGTRGAALNALVRQARGDNYADTVAETGLDATGVLHRFLQEKPKPTGGATGTGGEGEAQEKESKAPASDVGPQRPEVYEAAEALSAQQEANLERALSETRAEMERRREELEQREAGAEAQDDDEDDEEDGGDVEENDHSGESDEIRIPVEMMERFLVDVRDPATFSCLLRKITRNRILKANGLQADFAGDLDEAHRVERELWANPTNVAMFAKSMGAILRDMANRMLEHSSGAYTALIRKAALLPNYDSVDVIELEMQWAVRTLASASIRQTSAQIVNHTRAMLKRYIGPTVKNEHPELEEDLTRRITGRVREMAKWYRRVLSMSEGQVERTARGYDDKDGIHHDGLLDVLRNREKALDEADMGGKEGLKADAVWNKAAWKLAALSRFGGTRYLLPMEARERCAEIETWMAKEALKQAQKIEAIARKYEADRQTIIDGCAVIDPKTGKKRVWEQDTKTDAFWRATVNTINQRLRYLFARAGGKTGQAAQELLRRTSLELSRGTTRYLREKQEMRRDLVLAVRSVVGRRGVRQWLKRMTSEIPEEHSVALSKQGYRHLTYGQVMHLYGYLRQTATYGENIAKHGRETQRDYIEKNVLTAEDLKILNLMMKIYADRRAKLDEASRDITGFPMLNPDPFYLPVKIKTPTRGGLETTVSTVQAMPEVFSERRKHGLDVDEQADIMMIFHDRMEKTARVLGFGRTGLDIIHTFGDAKVKEAITEARGAKFTHDLIAHFTDWMNGGRPRLAGSDTEDSKLVNGLRTFAVYQALWGNTLSAFKQTLSPSVLTLAREIGDRGIFQDMAGRFAPGWKQAKVELTQSDPWKARYGDVGIMKETQEAVIGAGEGSLWQALLRAGMAPLQKGDATPAILCQVTEYMVERDRLIEEGMETEEAKRLAADKAMQEVEFTQQSSRAENLPRYARRGDSGKRMLMMFASSPMLQLGWEVQRCVEWKEKREAFGKDSKEAIGAAKTFWNAVIVNHVVMPILFQAATMVFNGILGKKEPDEDDLLELVFSMLSGPFARLAFWGGAMEAIYGVWTRRNSWRREADAAPSMLSNNVMNLVDVFGTIPLDAMTDGWDEVRKDLDSFLKRNLAPYRHFRKAQEAWVD